MRFVTATLLVILGGCARHPPPPPPAPAASRGPSYVDLEAGWRVVVITPMLRFGGFQLKKVEQQESGKTITLRAGDEFLGYETATYAVDAREDGGVQVALTAVDYNRNGAITPAIKSFAPRLRMPYRFRRVRLLYMQKVSDADHAMAVLAAPDPAQLAVLTRSVQASPKTACRANRNEYCEWIPAGVAVRPERPVNRGWVPAR